MNKTLNTKQADGYTTDEGVAVPTHALYRYTDENGEGGCWYSTIEHAERSWRRWVADAPSRERRRAQSARYRALVAARDAKDDA